MATGTLTKTILEGICCEEGNVIAQLHTFVLTVYVNNPFIYNWLDVYFMGVKIVLVIKDRVGICKGNSLNIYINSCKWKKACIFLLKITVE